MKKIKKFIIIILCLMIPYIAISSYIVYPKNTVSKGIDISEHQGEIDWQNLDTSEISFVFIRSSYGTEMDQYFYINYNQAKQKNLKIGIYHYLYATTIEGAIDEAKYLLNNIQGYTFDLPIYVDIEEVDHLSLSKNELTDIIVAFMNTIEEYNYKAGYYTNLSIYLKHLNTKVLNPYSTWIASYSSVLINAPDADYWQYTNTGKIAGIDTDVDFSYKIK